MKTQTGSYRVQGNAWVFRYRETVLRNGTPRRVARSRTIRGVSIEDRRAGLSTRKGHWRVPADVRSAGAAIIDPLNMMKGAATNVTIGDFVTEYLKERQAELKPGVHYNYVHTWERHLRARISGKMLRDYRRVDCFVLWKEIIRDNPNLCRQSMNHIKFLLSGIFNAAANRGLFTGENPAAADLPAGLRGRGKTEAYTVDEVKRMLDVFAGEIRAQAIIALAFGSGLRKGEIAALRWEDYEETAAGANIHVRQSVYNRVITTPKTEASVDVVKVGPEVCERLEAYRESAGDPRAGFMFCYNPVEDEEGRIKERCIDLQSFARWTMQPVLKAAGIPWKGWHAFRRGNATYLAAQLAGDGARVAAVMLRHGRQSVTEEHYIKNTKQDRRALQAYKQLEIDRTRDGAAGAIDAALRIN